MADCNRCSAGAPDVPYIAHESEMARLERANRRLWIACIALILALFASGMCRTIQAEGAHTETIVEVIDES